MFLTSCYLSANRLVLLEKHLLKISPNNMEPNGRVKKILDRQVHGLAPEPSDKKSLYSYSTPRDKIILLISFICAILGGVLNPLISVPSSVFS